MRVLGETLELIAIALLIGVVTTLIWGRIFVDLICWTVKAWDRWVERR